MARSCSASSIAVGRIGRRRPAEPGRRRGLGAAARVRQNPVAGPRPIARPQAHRRRAPAAAPDRDRSAGRRRISGALPLPPRAQARGARAQGASGSLQGRPRSAARTASSRIGSSTIFRGNIFSARPGTNTASKLRPRAASIGPTKTFPYRCTGGGTAISRSRLRRTMRTSLSVTGPTEAMGASSERIASTRSGCLSACVASAPELVEPLAPVRRGRQTVELVDQRQGVAGEGVEIVQRSRKRRRLRLVLFRKLCELEAQLVRASPRSDAASDRARRSPRPPPEGAPSGAAPQLSVSDGRIGRGRAAFAAGGAAGVVRFSGANGRDELGVGRDPGSPRDRASGGAPAGAASGT